ncbi:phage tail length tape measure family protein [Methylobacterium sp. 77]|uniref:phage tail length tape measure family protein n=1 Tax=Methylobacterium sp. 77 TaxID=1101192 RepID=UPI00037262FE|nr:phage tail length tape measure family protein [Methylobacterium sp. 77]
MTQSVAIRLGVEGGAEVKRVFDDTGTAGKQAFDGVVVSMDRASAASDRQVQRFQRLAQAAKEAEAAGRAQTSINSLLGVDTAPSASARSSAGVFEQQLRAAEEAERRNATIRDARATQMAASTQANVASAYGIDAAPAKSARASAEVFEEAARAHQDLEQRATALRAVIDPLGAAQLRMNAAVANADELLAKGSIKVTEHTAAVAKARMTYDEFSKTTERQRTGGLRPDQLQNLTYQVSDVVASAASGASPLTILLQQGGQVMQTFGPGQGGVSGVLSGVAEAVGKLVTPLTATAAIIGTIGGTLAYAYSTYSAGQREAQMSLNGIGRLSGATVAQLNATAEASARQGEVSVASAREMAGVYASTGRIAPQFFGDLIKIQRDYASTTKQEIPDATRELAGALANVATGVDALEAKLGPLGGGAGEMAKKLAAAGDQTGAVKVILDALPATLTKASSQMGGLSREWERTKQGFSDNINFIGKAMFGDGTDTFEKRIADAQARLAELEASRSKYGSKSNSYLYEAEATRQRKVVADLQAQADTARNAPARAQADDIANQSTRATKLVNPGLAGIEALEAVQKRIGNGLSTMLLSPDPKINVGAQEALETYKALNVQIAEMRANMAKGGDAAATALKQADFAKSTGDLQGYSLAVAQLNHQYDQLIESRKAGDAGRRTVSVESLNEARTAALAALAAQNRQAVIRATVIPNDSIATTIAAESGGNNYAKNQRSSALGAGQFLKSTFVELFRRYDTEAAAEIDAASANQKIADDTIAQLRTNRPISEKYIGIYLQQITKELTDTGYAGTPRNAQLGYFLGPGSAKKFLDADPSANAASVDRAAAAKNPEVFKNGAATVQDVLDYAQKRATGNNAPARASNERVVAIRAEAAAYDQSASRQEYLRTVQDQLNAARENGEEIGVRFKTAEELLKAPVSSLTAELQAQRSAILGVADARQKASSTALSSRFERDTSNAYGALGRTSEEQSVYMGARGYAEEGTKEFDAYYDRLRDLQRLSETKSTTGGFLKDLKIDLMQGAFLSTAMTNALGRLASRLSDKVLDSAISMMFAGSSKDGGSIGTFLTSILPKFATGMTPEGVVYGPGTGTSDSILAMISNGESIVNADATRRFGPMIKAMNENRLPRFAAGYVPKFDGPANSTGAQSIDLNVINQFEGARVEKREVPDGRGGKRPEILIREAFVQGASTRQGQQAMSQQRVATR